MAFPQEEVEGEEREEKQVLKKNNKKIEPRIEGIASSIRVVPHFPKPGTLYAPVFCIVVFFIPKLA